MLYLDIVVNMLDGFWSRSYELLSDASFLLSYNKLRAPRPPSLWLYNLFSEICLRSVQRSSLFVCSFSFLEDDNRGHMIVFLVVDKEGGSKS